MTTIPDIVNLLAEVDPEIANVDGVHEVLVSVSECGHVDDDPLERDRTYSFRIIWKMKDKSESKGR